MNLTKWLSALGLAVGCSAPLLAADPAGLLGSELPSAETLRQSGSPSLPIAPERLDEVLRLPLVQGMRELLKARVVDLTRRGSKEIVINRSVAPATVFLQQGDQGCTGAIVSPDGKILTCWHCVRGKGTITVRLHPGTGWKEAEARVVRTDPERDLALLQIISPRSISKLPTLALGKPSDLEVGADVYAIGHPLGMNWSFVKGMVSQIYPKRVWQSDANRHEAGVIQSQIPLYTGNSGGPLVSEQGMLVGINASKGEAEKFAFAVALPEIRQFLDSGKEIRTAPPVLAQAKGKTECAHKEVARGRNADNTGTIMLYDTNCDGKVDTQLLTLDGAAENLVIATSSDGSGRIDMVRTHRGGSVETYLANSTGKR